MFNEDLKLRYLDESEGRYVGIRYYMNNQFTKIEDTEERLGKDLCNFTVTDILDYYRTLCTSSLSYLIAINSQFKMYTQWCQSQNLVYDNQNHYDELDHEVLTTCVNYGLSQLQIISRDDLLSAITMLDNPSDAFLCLALFEGICGLRCEELLHLYVNDFHDGCVDLCSGRRLPVSLKLESLAIDSATTYEYFTFNDLGNPKGACYDLSDNRVIKRFRNATTCSSEHHNLYRKLVKIKNAIGSEAISAGLLQESGRIDMIKSIMKNKNQSIEECIKNNPEIAYRYGNIHSIPMYLKQYGNYF